MKKRSCLLFIISIMLISSASLAQKLEHFSDSLQGQSFATGRELTIYHPNIHLANGNAHPEQRSLRLRDAQAVASLQLKSGLNLSSDVEVRVNLLVSTRETNGRELQHENITLTVDTHPEAAKADRLRNGWNVKGIAYAKAQIRGIELFQNGKRSELSDMNSNELLQAIALKLELETITSYVNDPTKRPQIESNGINSQTGNIDLRWQQVPWADYYELEWMHVADYTDNLNQSIPATELLIPEWRFNATRISTSSTNYSIAQTFERGYVLYRIRAVAKNSYYNNNIYYGPWHFPRRQGDLNSGFVAGIDPTHFTQVDQNITFAGDRMNWQYIAEYREEGDRNEEVIFLDGTLRKRQRVNRNESGGIIFAQQPIYDHQGRQAITMMSSPVMQKEGTNDPYARRLNYQGNLAVDVNGNPYDKKDFDTDAFFTGCNPIKPARMGTQRGPSRYYSTENPDKSGAQSLLPDAEGYPFVRTRWSDDETGKIISVGTVGSDFQLGSGHENKFSFSVPSQSELDMLFGNDIGFAGHYRKLVSIDPNGQQVVTYKNLEDKVIATALLGETPAALKSIGGDAKTMFFDFNGIAPVVSADGMSLKTFGMIQTGIDNVNAKFTYNFRPSVMRQSFCGKNNCTDCRYQLSIEVRDDCGNVLHQYNRNIQQNNIDCGSNGEAIDASFDLVLPNKGTYSVYKTLRVDTSGFEEHFRRILADNQCEILNPQAIGTDQVNINCEMTCHECEAQARMVTDQFEREKLLMFCMGLCNGNSLTPPQLMRQQMMNDLKPGGQYALWRDTTQTNHPDPNFPYLGYPLSILNHTGDHLMGNSRASWKNPVIPYKNQQGRIDSIALPCVGDPTCDPERRGRPNQLEMLSDFIKNWKDTWAVSLLPYHPEFNYYRYMDSVERASSAFSLERNFRTSLISTTSFRAARDSNFLSLENNPANLDRAVSIFGIQQPLTNKLIQYQPKPDGRGFFSLSQYVYLSSRCAFLPDNAREDCMRQPLGGGIGNTGSDTIDNRDWNIFRALYLKERNRMIDSVVRKYMIDHGFPLNDCIGDQYCNMHYEGAYPLAPAQHLYASKQKRFPVLGENYDNLPFNTIGSDMEDAQEIINYAERLNGEKCEQCPPVVALEGMLSIMANSKLLAKPHILNRETIVPNILMEPLGIRSTAQWVPVITGEKEMKVVILDPKGRKLCEVSMMPSGNAEEIEKFDWRKIGFINCLQQTNNSRKYARESSKKNFTMVAYDSLYGSYNIEGHISCLELNDCDPPKNCEYTCALESYNILIPIMLKKASNTESGVISNNEVNYARLEECLLAGKVEPKIRTIEFYNFRIRIYFTSLFKMGNNTRKAVEEFCDIDVPKFAYGNGNSVVMLRLQPMPVGKKECSTNKLMGTFKVISPKRSEIVQREVEARCAPYVNCCVPQKTDTCASALAGMKWSRGLVLINNKPTLNPQLKDIRTEITKSNTNATLWQQDISLTNSGSQQVVFEIINREKPGMSAKEIASVFQLKIGEEQSKGGFEVSTSDRGTVLLKMNVDAGSGRKIRLALSQLNDKSTIDPGSWEIRDISIKPENCKSCCTPIVPPPTITPQQDCATQAAEITKQINERRKNIFIDSLRKELLKQYIDHCINNGRDRFEASYQDKFYHFTLYYYDNAGNLVKTVSPAGVKTLDADGLEAVRKHRESSEVNRPLYPAHTMVTTYEYNSQNYITRKRSPDAGISKNWYDRLGRVMLTQQANQVARNAYNYTIYDALGREEENGEWNSNRSIDDNEMKRFASNSNALKISIHEQLRTNVSFIQYDKVLNEKVQSLIGDEPSHYRGRASSSLHANALDPQVTIFQHYDHATHMKYDIHGNVKSFITEFPSQATGEESLVKKIDYVLGSVSGKLREIRYQDGKPDAFFHRYEYGEAGDLKSVKTSRNGFWWDNDMRNHYYKHGKLARQELGQDKIQGIDMTYTLQGWMKSMNHPTGNIQSDPGKDGQDNGYARDVYNYSIGFHQNDYRSIGRTHNLPFVTGNQDAASGLYDGNIRSIVQNNGAFINQPIHASIFKYDQLDRLLSMERLIPQGNAWQPIEGYKTTQRYDPDGNILSIERNGNDAMLQMDKLQYNYRSGTHQLNHLQDEIASELYTDDLDSQEPDNYVYDESGNMISDRAGDISNITWTWNGKVSTITKGRATTSYSYDATGFRVMKTDRNKKTFYVRDAYGRVIAIYEQDKEGVKWKEASIYAYEQIGTYQPNEIDLADSIRSTLSQFRGLKKYELKNHLADVMLVVMDKKQQLNGVNLAVIATAEDHYPFGSPMPGRKFNMSGYRYGYNGGGERDDELYGEGNSYQSLYRMLDTRIGRWWSVDPLSDDLMPQNPYTAMANNPIIGNDPKGDWFNVVVGGFVGAAVETATQAVTNAIDPEKDWYDFNYYLIGASAIEGAATSGVSGITNIGKATIKIGSKVLGKEASINFGIEAVSSVVKSGIEYHDEHKKKDYTISDGVNVVANATIDLGVGKLIGMGVGKIMGEKADDAAEAVTEAVEAAPVVKQPGLIKKTLDKIKVPEKLTELKERAKTAIKQQLASSSGIARKVAKGLRKIATNAFVKEGVKTTAEVGSDIAVGDQVDKLKFKDEKKEQEEKK